MSASCAAASSRPSLETRARWTTCFATSSIPCCATRAAVKSLARDRREELFAEPPDVAAEEPIVEDQRLDDVVAYARTLPPASRVVIEMHFLDGMKLWEVAEALEVAEGTVKSRLAYGLAALRKSLSSRP